ncbi:M48 family metallopeptidase [Microvirga lotononidis]|uniref:Peptidase family M48 n=1 Tax=Microvirga lotononidis TaxID=864069 RepID=I4YQ95_9HYPH|nr:M48 family metallopeptidase [Microvirga lotononidis]EIM26137.1 Peptidase family M48 [Microvirga lotononidis]WQO26041.1 M48 family metallopeptidase [Microvirga lotononidis]
MTDAVFYDGESARRRTVNLKVTATSLDIHEGGEWIASWPVGAVRRKDAPQGVLRLTCESGPSLARLDVADTTDQETIRLHCRHLETGHGRERTGQILFWSVSAAASILLCVFYLLPILAERLTPFIPISYERHLGKAVDNQVRAIFSGKICEETRGDAAMRTLIAQLTKSQDTPLDVDVAVIESKVPNAIALPGGRIYLFSALLEKAESADEIAGVLAHEMGHVAHRDGLRRMIQAGGTSYLLGLLFGDVTGGGAIVFVSRYLIDSAYSRDAETAADDFAGRTMTALGRPAHAMALLLKRIDGKDDAKSGNDFSIPAFLSTHPVTDQRLKALEKQVPSQQGEPLLSQEEWRALKEICKTT